MTIRYPVQVRRSPAFESILDAWHKIAGSGRGTDARSCRQRLKEVVRLEAILPRKPFAGRNVPKDLIPKKYRQQGVSNLFRNDLPGGWRMLHTLMEIGGEQAVIELDAMSHADYDELFGYEKR